MSKLRAEFTNYMKIALKNDSIDYFRMQRKNNVLLTSLSCKGVQEVSVSHFCDMGTFSFDKFDLYGIENKKLYLAIESLTHKQKEMLFLYAEGLTVREISDYLGITIGAVKSIISKTKKKINKDLKG